ncbi:hypothetical protein GH733_012126 [Mirounga leonina]|nr:hypothetical protein GH733_012126 [Mirounga leonina]
MRNGSHSKKAKGMWVTKGKRIGLGTCSWRTAAESGGKRMPGQTGKGEPGERCPGAGSHIEEEMDNGFECQGEAEEKPGARGTLRSTPVGLSSWDMQSPEAEQALTCPVVWAVVMRLCCGSLPLAGDASHLVVPLLSDSPSEDTDLKDTYLIPRNIMAEPDYIEDDNPELIRPQKLVNPVKTSRNHQDLHRELLMNQKRGLAPQNKPELQKVMEKRKRDQLELEKQKLQEEQENAPEFVKVKGNLRRTGQEVAQAQES